MYGQIHRHFVQFSPVPPPPPGSAAYSFNVLPIYTVGSIVVICFCQAPFALWVRSTIASTGVDSRHFQLGLYQVQGLFGIESEPVS
jgi:hypothetical protein